MHVQTNCSKTSKLNIKEYGQSADDVLANSILN